MNPPDYPRSMSEIYSQKFSRIRLSGTFQFWMAYVYLR